MSKPNQGDVLFWSLAAVAAAAFVFFALVLVGAVPIGSAEPAVVAAAPVEAEPEPSVEDPVADAPRPEPDIEQGSRTSSRGARLRVRRSHPPRGS